MEKEEQYKEVWIEYFRYLLIEKVQEYKKYRGITLLNIAYNILSTIIQQRLGTEAVNTIWKYQCGFTKGKLTADLKYTKINNGQTNEYKIGIIILIDAKQAFDSVNRNKLMETVKELEVTAKIKHLI